MITTRGHVEQVDIDAFREAGFGHHLVLEFITIVAASVITNYTANGANPPLEPALQPHAERIAERGGQAGLRPGPASERVPAPRASASSTAINALHLQPPPCFSRSTASARASRPEVLPVLVLEMGEHRDKHRLAAELRKLTV